MDFEQLLNESKKWMDDANEKVNKWMEDLSLPSRINGVHEKLKKIPAHLETQIEQWENQIKPYFQNIIPEIKGLPSEFDAFREKTRIAWERMAGLLVLGDRYLEAVQTIVTIIVKIQWFDKYADRLSREEREIKEQELHQQNAEDLTNLCKRQGGAWVKAAQFLSSQGDWLPSVYIESLSFLQDQAPVVSWESIENVLKEDLGENWKERFHNITPTPIATASIAQVYKAQLPHGPIIALKIQLPEAPDKIRSDLMFFQAAARLINDYMDSVDLEQIINELSKNILLELDYYHEAANLTRVSTYYSSTQWEFPRLISDLLTQRVLAMNFIEGVPVREFLQEVPSAAESVLTELAKSFIQQIFITGLFHADPHPGNFFVTPKGKLALLDFGAVGQLSEKETENYRAILVALLLRQENGFAELLTNAGFTVPQPEKLEQMLFQKNKDEFNGLTKLQVYLKIMRDAQVSIPDNFVLMARVLISIGGLLNQHQVRLDLKDLAFSLMR